jgi:hypothetical protein
MDTQYDDIQTHPVGTQHHGAEYWTLSIMTHTTIISYGHSEGREGREGGERIGERDRRVE